jgi:protein SCO1/2
VPEGRNGTASPDPPDDSFVVPRWLKAIAVFMGLIIVAAMAFAILEPIQVLPRIRLAPGYALVAQDGATYTSEAARGSVTLYNFAPTDCDAECANMESTMRAVQAQVAADVDLGDTDFRLVTIALDATDPGTLTRAANRVGADGQRWRWLGSDDPDLIRNVVGRGFGRFYETADGGQIRFDPSFVLVDGNGVVRGDYRYSTLAEDSDKLADHMAVLGDEIRHANGAAAVAYEAAHLFLCYP